MQVVVAPHIYPPSISKATSDYAGSGLYNRLTKSFGSLNKAGYCLSDGTTCHQFALAIGETGTAFTDALDTPAMADFAKWLTNTGMQVADRSQHSCIGFLALYRICGSWSPSRYRVALYVSHC